MGDAEGAPRAVAMFSSPLRLSWTRRISRVTSRAPTFGTAFSSAALGRRLDGPLLIALLKIDGLERRFAFLVQLVQAGEFFEKVGLVESAEQEWESAGLEGVDDLVRGQRVSLAIPTQAVGHTA